MGMFDQAARYACRTAPEVVARRLLRKVRERLELDQFHDTRTAPLPGQRDRTVDSVLSLRNLDKPNSPGLVILEFQTRHDKDKLHTTLVSVAHMRADVRHGAERKGLYEVFAGLVYLRGRASDVTLDMALTDESGQRLAGTWHTVLFWNVEEDEASQALAEAAADFERCWGLLFWVPLMRNAATPENIASWLALLLRLPGKRLQGDLARIAITFAELAGTLPQWQEALKEVDMEESQVILEWTADARRQGQVEALRATLLRLAQIRFKAELTDEDRQMISTQGSVGVLDEWLNAVVKADDYAGFRAVLRR
jgi:hypothetical protein